MPGLFNALNIGYTGLNASQVGINTISQNVANAETDGYSRKRVVQSSSTPLYTAPGNVGNGVDILDIERVYDDFVFRKYTSTYSDKEQSDYMTKTLEELSTYFPEVDDVGVKADLKEFYNLWQTFADNPTDSSVKVALAEQTNTLTNHIQQLNSQVYDLQQKLNDELKVNVDEVNKLASQIAELNKEIDKAEAGGGYTASDLRDQRGVLERDIARLIGGEVSVDTLNSNITIDASVTEPSGGYNLHVNGFNIVDGGSFHPLKVDNSKSSDGFYGIYYERQDGVLVEMDQYSAGGKIGGLLELRGDKIDEKTGMPTNGIIQDTYNQLNEFSSTFIKSINNIYAKTGTQDMQSNPLELDTKQPLVNGDEGVKTGSFDIVVYDIDGNEVSRRAINIDGATTIEGPDGSNSIEAQVKANLDDNNDGNANNDIDNMIVFGINEAPNGKKSLQFSLESTYKSEGYTFAIEDNLTSDSFDSGTNFAGALGLNKFLDGNNAKDISLNYELRDDPSKISAGINDESGDNTVALDMVQHQFEKFDFTVGQETYNETAYGYFDLLSTNVGIQASKAAVYNDTITAQFNATELEYQSVSKVNIDEEMTNLIKVQTAYSASAKVITTIDQMLNTLLGIKQ
jgi:flagellar hook-associated protein 1 FlgK